MSSSSRGGVTAMSGIISCPRHLLRGSWPASTPARLPAPSRPRRPRPPASRRRPCPLAAAGSRGRSRPPRRARSRRRRPLWRRPGRGPCFFLRGVEESEFGGGGGMSGKEKEGRPETCSAEEAKRETENGTQRTPHCCRQGFPAGHGVDPFLGQGRRGGPPVAPRGEGAGGRGDGDAGGGRADRRDRERRRRIARRGSVAAAGSGGVGLSFAACRRLLRCRLWHLAREGGSARMRRGLKERKCVHFHRSTLSSSLSIVLTAIETEPLLPSILPASSFRQQPHRSPGASLPQL